MKCENMQTNKGKQEVQENLERFFLYNNRQ